MKLRNNISLRPSQGFWGTGKREIISGGQGNKCQILRGTGEQKQYWGTENKKTNFRFLENRETSQFVSEKQGNRYPPPPLGGPHLY